ncbi:MAG: hypothetical protein HKN45_09155, partial [Flavobacteriales bacterium]|nr:hypothetical protein [Flavobacteriales bacterium]
GVPSSYPNWGVVIEGEVYKKCPWGYQQLFGEEDLTTYVFLDQTNAGDVAILAAGLNAGFIGGAILGALVAATSSPKEIEASLSTLYNGCAHELDLRNGGLRYVVTNPRRPIATEIYLTFSKFSKVDCVELNFRGESLILHQQEYTKLMAWPMINSENVLCSISDGSREEIIPVQFNKIGKGYHLIIGRKKEIRIDELTGDEFKSREATYVDWPDL